MLGVGLAGAQAGHLLAYQLRFGFIADRMQSTGAHTYFLPLAKTALGLGGVTLIAALLLIGASRVIRPRSLQRVAGGPSYLSVLAGLFTIQLAFFMTQETIESVLAGGRAATAVDLLLWGILGQLPVAAVGAAALGWLWTRVERAVESLSDFIHVRAVAPFTSSVLALAISQSDLALLRTHAARSRIAKRGPPDPSL